MNKQAIALAALVAAMFAPAAVCGNRSSAPRLSGSREYALRVWRTQDGLPENNIQAISQTPDGYLWIGTAGGLVRFDGARFLVYSRANTPTFVNDSVRILLCARDGSLWLGTDGGGLLRLHNGTFRAYGEREGLTNGFIKGVYQDGDGTLWVTTAHGLFRLDGNRLVRIPEPPNLQVSAFFVIEPRRDGGLWVRSPKGWFVLSGGRITGEPVPDVIRDSPAGNCAADTAGGAIRNLGHSGDLSIGAPGDGTPGGAIRYTDHAGDLWIGTTGDGLLKIHNCAVNTWTAPGELPDNSINAIYEDRESSVWVGTDDGLLRLSKSTVLTLGEKDGFSESNISTAYQDNEGVVWATTLTGRVFRLVNGEVKPYRLPPNAADMKVKTIFQDSHGSLFMGTNDFGFAKISAGRATRYTTRDGLRNNTISSFFEDRRGILWIASSSGLTRWDGSSFRNYYLEDGLVYGYVRIIAEDRNGDILVGTDCGVSRVHNDKIVPDPLLTSAGREKINSIYVDSGGNIWLATMGAGLIRVGHGTVSPLTSKSGLLSNSIYQIVEDGKGKLWMSSPAGVFSVLLSDLNAVADRHVASVAVAAYGLADGMESTQMTGGLHAAGTLLPDGRLAFPSVKGLVIIDPQRNRDEKPSPVHVETVLVDGTPVSMRGDLVIPPGHRNLQIDFTACSLLSADRMSFRYRLRGYSDNWSVAIGPRNAQYSNLTPGRYTFEVVAQDGAIPGSVSEAGIGFTWQPYFYQTSWFYTASILFLCGAIWSGFRYYAHQERTRYSLRLAERARVARDMHDTLIQGCIGASTLLEAAAGFPGLNPGPLGEYLDRARIQLRLTLDEARQALSDLRHDSFAHGLPGALEDLSRSISHEMKIPVDVDVEGAPSPLPESVSRNLLLIAREAIRNSISHAEPTRIQIVLSFAAAQLQLEIRDDGRGFVIDPGGYRARDHFGITGMRERIEQIGGSFSLKSEPGKGTRATAVLPL